eukprot:4681165-Amphidinium_carterae.1
MVSSAQLVGGLELRQVWKQAKKMTVLKVAGGENAKDLRHHLNNGGSTVATSVLSALRSTALAHRARYQPLLRLVVAGLQAPTPGAESVSDEQLLSSATQPQACLQLTRPQFGSILGQTELTAWLALCLSILAFVIP